VTGMFFISSSPTIFWTGSQPAKIISGGLNPVAVMVERGKSLESKALAGLVGYDRLFPYTELDERVRALA